MSRQSRVRVLALTALIAAAGCQDYNFNPVGHCLIQPGTRRVTLSDISTADVLFVVDDSGSMGGEQEKLSQEFDTFIANLHQTNMSRVQNGLIPIDFHLAVTTSSVFENLPDSSSPYCRSDCPDPAGGTVGGSVCCETLGTTPIRPYLAVQKCSGPSDTGCASGSTCRNDCNSFLGEFVCCDASKIPVRNQQIACETVGAACGNLSTHYRTTSSPTCSPFSGKPYPQGDFVAVGASPLVLHFDKEIYTDGAGCLAGSCPNKEGLQASALIDFFKANVKVGTCGSNQESALEAARRAVDREMAKPAAEREWIHDNSKLVLVFVGDEDDCSSPQDPSRGIILTGAPGVDSCATDSALPASEQKLFPVGSFSQHFTGELDGRPVGAAFIVSARANGQDVCQDETCVADICCDTVCTGNASVCTSATCGGQAKGTRLLQTAADLRGNAADVVAGSICDPDFGTLLGRIADIVKPPSGLLLPSQPAAETVIVVRIARADGKTRKTCRGPAPAAMTAAEAAAAGYDWWFTAGRDQITEAEKDPSAASKYVYINHDTRNCEASPGETYSADYIGRLPEGGCSGATAAEADDACVAALGGRTGDWTCFAGTDSAGACVVPTGGIVGTCICGGRAGNCPNG